ncbi:MarR family transcriptional regulator [Vibrio fortis]|uniref:MarR family transcriptional regulator n=2 Tax=Vibrio fortis TaxID=212667 RepID=A0A5N3QTX3_9VIBR|nr:MarR family transcriptional regulator [Vibrio fortis]
MSYIGSNRNRSIAAGELSEKLDIPKATVSRNLRMLGKKATPTKDGIHLLDMEHTKEDYRVRVAVLTEKGEEFLAELGDALS